MIVGVDVKGPAAVISLATTVNHTKGAPYTLFNMEVTPSILKSTDDLRKPIPLIKIHFARGGVHIQFNLTGQKTLYEAKKHPDQYRELLVRLAGHSAYFVDLSPEVQDKILSRTEYTLSIKS